MSTVEHKEQQKIPASERILKVASEMFYHQGIKAVGVDAIAREAGVTKKTLYEKYGSKKELIATYLRERDQRWRHFLSESVECQGGSARERLLSTFDALEVWMERENPRGCGFVNAAAELTEADHPGRIAVIEQKEWLRNYLLKLATETRIQEPEALVEKLLILHEGATVVNSLGVATDAAQKARAIAASLLKSLPQ